MREHGTHNGFQEMQWALVRRWLWSWLFALLVAALIIFMLMMMETPAY